MLDPRLGLIEKVVTENCKVVFSGPPIVLLCGGYVPDTDSSTSPASSFRHLISRQDTSFEIFRPEEVKNWREDGTFDDLVDFELSLAALSSLIVVILESAGSIAELGFFSQLEDLRSKLVAVASHEYIEGNSARSFINLGLLNFLRNSRSGSVRDYPVGCLMSDAWATEHQKVSVDDDIIENVISDIEDEIEALKTNTQKFKLEVATHLFIVAFELVRLFVAIKDRELFDYLKRFGFPKLNLKKVRQILFILERFRLVKSQSYSDGVFYIANDQSFHRLQWSLKEDSFDELRFSTDLREYYSSSSKGVDRHRVGAIKLSGRGHAL